MLKTFHWFPDTLKIKMTLFHIVYQLHGTLQVFNENNLLNGWGRFQGINKEWWGSQNCGILLPSWAQKREGEGSWRCGRSCCQSSLWPLPESQYSPTAQAECPHAFLVHLLIPCWGLSLAEENWESEDPRWSSQGWAFQITDQGKRRAKEGPGYNYRTELFPGWY